MAQPPHAQPGDADPPEADPAEPEPAGAAPAGSPAEGPGGRPSRKPFLLRLPPELMEELRLWASAELRSVNGHIEYLLREAVKRRKR